MPARLEIADRAGGVRVIAIDHPPRKNALDAGAIDALARALEPESLEGVRVLLLRGAGKDAFCAGYDLTALAPVAESGGLPDDTLEDTLSRLAAAPVPSIALVHGAAFGAGCDLACACDFRVGSSASVFCMPPARLGVVYASRGIARVQALVGSARAKRMFFTGVKVPGDVAAAWGLLDELEDDADEAEVSAFRLADEIAQMAPLAIRGMKRTFAALSGSGLDPTTRDALRALRREAFSSQDAQEGKAAFLEKRTPRFKGQ